MVKKEKGKRGMRAEEPGTGLLGEPSQVQIFKHLKKKKKKLNAQFIGLFVLVEYGKTLCKVGERSVWRSCLVRYQRLNSSVIPLQSTFVPEEARAGHR